MENEPIANIDLWGTQKVSAIINDGKARMNENLSPKNLIMGTSSQQKTETLANLHNTAKRKDLKNAGNGVDDSRADCVGDVCSTVQNLAITATVLSGGTTAKITVPLAGAAEFGITGSLLVKALTDYLRDGKLDNCTELLNKGISSMLGTKGGIGVKNIKNLGKLENEKATKSVLKGTTAGVLNVAEEAANKSLNHEKPRD